LCSHSELIIEQGIDDFVYVVSSTTSGIAYWVALNLGMDSSGVPQFGPLGFFVFQFNCLVRGIRFADMTGDGRDDYCCINLPGKYISRIFLGRFIYF
jgi:hypothetical protein